MIARTQLTARGAQSRRVSLAPPTAPAWASELAGRRLERPPLERPGRAPRSRVRLRASRSPGAALAEATRPDACELDDGAFESAARECYALLLRYLAARGRHPVRFWNYLPRIHQPAGAGLTRYEVFNRGRWSAYTEQLGGPIGGRVPAASAVGHRGRDLVIQVLAARAPGHHVENPRQRPAYRYSERYGPVAPSFARATLVSDGPARWAAISGTASVVGEDSRHDGCLGDQLDETLENLAHIAQCVAERAGEPCHDALRYLRSARAYVVRERDVGTVHRALEQSLPAAEHIEIVDADLCRAELLVEVEGLAILSEPLRLE